MYESQEGRMSWYDDYKDQRDAEADYLDDLARNKRRLDELKAKNEGPNE
jgi:hypothetical protein